MNQISSYFKHNKNIESAFLYYKMTLFHLLHALIAFHLERMDLFDRDNIIVIAYLEAMKGFWILRVVDSTTLTIWSLLPFQYYTYKNQAIQLIIVLPVTCLAIITIKGNIQYYVRLFLLVCTCAVLHDMYTFQEYVYYGL